MGSILGKQMKETMEENMKQNQEFMLSMQATTVRIASLDTPMPNLMHCSHDD